MTEPEAISEAACGCAEAFQYLYSKYIKFVRIRCTELLENDSEVDDAAQEIFLLVYKKLASFKSNSTFSTWLYRVTTNYCLNQIRARKTHSRYFDCYEGIPDPRAPADAQLELEIGEALKVLDPEEKEIFVGCSVESVSRKKMSIERGVTEARVNTVFDTAQGKLQRYFASH